MRYFTTGDESRAIDNKTINETGIPQLVLMERASLALAEEIAKAAAAGSRLLFVAAGGNNGGDGVAAARIMKEWGYDTEVLFVDALSKTSDAFRTQISIAESCGVKITVTSDAGVSFEGYDVIVDALFGVGLSRNIEGIWKDIICRINEIKSKNSGRVLIVSADIPSGISSESGKVMGEAIKADMTVTFGFIKRGMLFGEGREYSGRIVIRDIGFPAHVTKEVGPLCYGLDKADIRKMLPVRRADANKGNFGRLLLVAGSRDICGAAVIAGRAAFSMGAGLVKIFTDKANRDIICIALPEALIETYDSEELEEKSDGPKKEDGSTISDGLEKFDVVGTALREKIRKAVEWCTAAAIGPGTGTGETAKLILKEVLDAAAETGKPVVIDADGINIFSGDRSILKDRKPSGDERNIILTPHILEMARLIRENGEDIRETVEKIKNDRFEVAKKASNEYNMILVLKDARTVVTAGADSFYINTNGNSGMAKGGSGDSLTGIIGALTAGGMEPLAAARTGTFIHGAAGDKAAEEKGMTGMTAMDLNGCIRKVLEEL